MKRDLDVAIADRCLIPSDYVTVLFGASRGIRDRPGSAVGPEQINIGPVENWRAGGESTHDSAPSQYTSFCGMI